MKLEILRSADQIERIGEEWSDLLATSADDKVHYGYKWFLASWRVFHIRDSLHVITLRDADATLKCIAPFVIVTDRFGPLRLTKICFPRNNQNPSNDIIYVAGSEEECLNCLMEYLCGFHAWDMIDLQVLHVDGSTARFLNDFLPQKKQFWGTSASRATPYITIEGDWARFWSAKTPKFRKSMRYKLNKAGEQGYTVDRICFPGADLDSLDVMLDVSSRSWKRSIGTDLTSRKDNFAFYKELCAGIGASATASLYVLRVGGLPAAFEFHLEKGGVVFPLRADFDQAFEPVSPGSVLEYEIIKQLFERGLVREYNSCGTTYAYLLKWTNSVRPYRNWAVSGRSPAARYALSYEYFAIPAIRKIRAYYQSVRSRIVERSTSRTGM